MDEWGATHDATTQHLTRTLKPGNLAVFLWISGMRNGTKMVRHKQSGHTHRGIGMIRALLRPIWSRLPVGVRRSVRSIRLEYLVRRGHFSANEPEFLRLAEWLGPGDIALDIGANFGCYTLRMSALVGDSGHVFSFEPVPQTFAMFVRALSAGGCRNVCALNLACSNGNGYTTMSIPDDPLTGENLYRASISQSGPSLTRICRAKLDDLALPLEGLKVVKIDAEGHDAEVIEGMWNVLARSLPVIIIEHPSDELSQRLVGLGYRASKHPGSPNSVFIRSA